MQKSVTQILARKIQSFGPGPNNTVVVTTIVNVTSKTSSPLFNYSKNHYGFEPKTCKRITAMRDRQNSVWPGCVPPYSDFEHFFGETKPWLLHPPPLNLWKRQHYNGTSLLNARNPPLVLWWHMLYRLEQEGITSMTYLIQIPTKIE